MAVQIKDVPEDQICLEITVMIKAGRMKITLNKQLDNKWTITGE